MKNTLYLAVAIVLLIAISCRTRSTDAAKTGAIVESNTPPVEVNYVDLSKGTIRYSGLTDLYSISEVKYIDGFIYVNVRYSGGCESHTFDVVWDGSMKKSLPPQIDLQIYHHANDDRCQAMVSRELKIDPAVFFGDTEAEYTIVNQSDKARFKVEE